MKLRWQCAHYNGVHMGKCEAGVEYSSFLQNPDIDDPAPAFIGIAPCVVRVFSRDKRGKNTGYVRVRGTACECPSFEKQPYERNSEESKEYALAKSAVMRLFPLIQKFRFDSPTNAHAVVGCPVCYSGRVHLSQSARSGSIRAHCDTPGCVHHVTP